MGDRDSRALATLTVLSRRISAHEVGERVGVAQATLTERSSSASGESERAGAYAVLELKSELDRAAPPQAHLDDLLKRVWPVRERLHNFAREARAEDADTVPIRVWLNVESADGRLGVDITAEQLSQIAALGAHLGIELETTDYPARAFAGE